MPFSPDASVSASQPPAAPLLTIPPAFNASSQQVQALVEEARARLGQQQQQQASPAAGVQAPPAPPPPAARLSPGAIAGIVVGTLLGLALVLVLAWAFLLRWRRHRWVSIEHVSPVQSSPGRRSVVSPARNCTCLTQRSSLQRSPVCFAA